MPYSQALSLAFLPRVSLSTFPYGSHLLPIDYLSCTVSVCMPFDFLQTDWQAQANKPSLNFTHHAQIVHFAYFAFPHFHRYRHTLLTTSHIIASSFVHSQIIENVASDLCLSPPSYFELTYGPYICITLQMTKVHTYPANHPYLQDPQRHIPTCQAWQLGHDPQASAINLSCIMLNPAPQSQSHIKLLSVKRTYQNWH